MDTFLIRNALKQGDGLLLLLLGFALQLAVTKNQANQDGWKLSGTHFLLPVLMT
jgi:hypothetical protein